MTRALWVLLRPYAPRLVLAGAIGAAAELAALGLIATAGWLIARAAQQPLVGALTLVIVGVRALALSRGALRYLERLIGHDIALRALADIRARVYAALVPRSPSLSAGEERRWRRGDLVSRAAADTEGVQDLLLRALLPVSAAAVLGAAATALAFSVDPVAGAALGAGLLAAGVLVPVPAERASTRASAAAAALRGELWVLVSDLLEGSAELMIYGGTREAEARVERCGARLAAAQARAERCEAAGGMLIMAVQGATVIAVTALAIGRPGVDGVMVVVMGLLALAAFEPLRGVPSALIRYRASRAALLRVTAVLDEGTGGADLADAREDGSSVPEAVGFALRSATVPTEPGRPRALDRFTLDVPAGRKIALVGPSGAGKSTALAVLMGLVRPAEGTALLAGRPLSDHPQGSLPRLVTGISHDDHVFNLSVAENLLLAKPGAEQAELEAAARRVGLAAEIDALPEGWETVAGQDGARFSGGQRQRLCLARALLADTPLLVLDEPTEGVDEEAADRLVRDVLTAAGPRTVVLVTHRLRELGPDAAGDLIDEVVVVEGGSVAQKGSHAELVEAPGYYRERWLAETAGATRSRAAAKRVEAGL